MKDIDFDELDRAVSSLMNDVPKTEPVKNDDVKTVTLSTANQTENQAETAAPDEPAMSGGITEVPTRSTVVSSSPAVMPAARRGRFMDMVRSPARETRKPITSASVSRHGTIIDPVGPHRSRVVGNPILAEASTSNTDQPVSADAVADTVTTEPTSVVPEKRGNNISTPDTSSTEPVADQSPIAPPFLPDAKVEKRPLGRTTDTKESPAHIESTAAADEISMAPAGIISDNLSTNPDAQLPEQPLPAELDSKLLDIETSTAGLPGEPSVVSPAHEKSVSNMSTAQSGSSRPLAATSIPQQYKVQPKVSEESASGTIYDTASYHQPLAHPPKKKPGWLWVVAIIVILLLGAAGGAVAYYLGLV